jgi:hypothetical protein
MVYDHLCHSPENVQQPDRTACRNLSNGFSDSQGFVQAVMSIVTKATAAHGVITVVGSAAKRPYYLFMQQ